MFGEARAGAAQLGGELQAAAGACVSDPSLTAERTFAMAWSTPVLIEICIGLEINGYLPAEL
jgi:coenzyme PQQ precursor peptide PqqA